MPRGGARTGAGRPAGTYISPDAADRLRALIQTKSIIQRLTGAINGDFDMPAQAVTAALGLLRKVLPDLSAAEHKVEHLHRFVARVPDKAVDSSAWQQQHDQKLLEKPTIQ